MMNQSKLTITAKTTEVLEKLKNNRAAHRDLVEEARRGYVEAARKAVQEKMDALAAGKIVALSFNLVLPSDFTKEYDTAIAMLEMHLSAEQEYITLSAADAQQFICDNWDWAHNFLTSNAGYSPRTYALAMEKGYHRD